MARKRKPPTRRKVRARPRPKIKKVVRRPVPVKIKRKTHAAVQKKKPARAHKIRTRRIRRAPAGATKRAHVVRRAARGIARGFSTRAKVHSRKLGAVTVERKGTRFAKGIGGRKIGQKESEIKSIARRHFESIGASINDLYYVKLMVEFKFNGKLKKEYFSIPMSKIKNLNQLDAHMDDLISAFEGKQSAYSRGGFSEMKVVGVVVQGYE